MPPTLYSRRKVALGIAALPAAMSVPIAARGASDSADGPTEPGAEGLTRTSEAIHQEVSFKAGRRAVYEALTTSKSFDAITRLSDAVTLVTAPNARPTSISRSVGGPFTLFGGYITGRNLELVPHERVVQAWRVGNWKPGEYSMVRFALVAEGTGTRLIFDHRGFPDGAGAHLASGWHTHYWEPLSRYLAGG